MVVGTVVGNITDADAADEVTPAASVIVTNTDSGVCTETVGAIVHVFVVDVQSDAEETTPDGSIHEYVSGSVPV
jgi:hypothetical protein